MSAEFESNVTSIERIKEYCETPHEAKWIDEQNRPPANWPQNGAVQFESYTVKYREELDPVLKNIDCTISAGEKVNHTLRY
jgi:ABC-type multidrug transport system fused ATPase/permease subunit